MLCACKQFREQITATMVRSPNLQTTNQWSLIVWEHLGRQMGKGMKSNESQRSLQEQCAARRFSSNASAVSCPFEIQSCNFSSFFVVAITHIYLHIRIQHRPEVICPRHVKSLPFSASISVWFCLGCVHHVITAESLESLRKCDKRPIRKKHSVSVREIKSALAIIHAHSEQP